MTDAIRELFEMLAKKENTGSDYTGTITRVDGNTAYVRFNGSDIDDTPVALSIGASEGDTVRVRVADGRAWLVGNDTAPPNDSSGVAYDLIRTNAYIRQLTTERIYGENGWINLLTGTFDYGNGALSWNGDHLTVKGAITATSGQIGPWNITSSAIYKVSSTWGSSTAGAAYFGNSGISITDKFKVDANGALTATGATISGVITATSGELGGWTLTSTSIYASANNAGTGNVQRWTGLQIPGNGAWAIAVGITDFSSWATAPFRVNHKGEMYATGATITGNITASTGSIGGFHIVNTSNSGTTANGGHCYGIGMYAQSSDSNYEYEIGMKGDSGSPGYAAFYVGRIAKGAAWSTNTKTFYVTNAGSLMATAGTLGPWTLNASGLTNTASGRTTNVYPGGIYFGASGVSINLSDCGLNISSSSGSTNVLQNTITASNGTVTATMNYLGYAVSGTAQNDAVRFGHGSGSSKNVGIWDATINGWIVGHGSDNHITVLPYYTPSDIRIKTDINRSKVKALDVLRQVDIVEFKRYGVYQPIGMISDWMEQLDPQFVGGGGYDEQGNMVIKYIDMFYLQGYLIKAIQELADKVSKLGG